MVVLRRSRAGRIAHGPIGRLRTRLRETVPLIDGRPRQRAAGREVDRDKQVALGSAAREGAAASGGDPDHALEEFKVHVAVTVVDQPLGREENLRVPGVGPGVADRVDVLRSSLAGTAPEVVPIAVNASPFFAPPAMVVESPPPQEVVSLEIASTTKTAEMMLGSVAAAGVTVGAIGGPVPPLGRPQLNSPPGPLRFTAPAAHTYVGAPLPELAQS